MDVAVKNALAALKIVLNVRQDERLLVVTDRDSLVVGEGFALAGLHLGMVVRLEVLPWEKRPLTDVPKRVVDVINGDRPKFAINCLRKSAEETPFRIKLIQVEQNCDAIIAHMPNVNIQMLSEGPLALSEDQYREMQDMAERLGLLLRGVDRLRVTAPGGTDAELRILGRPAITDIRITREYWGNLPCGEIEIAPIENSLNGFLFIEGTIGDLGIPPKPVLIHAKDGRIEKMECEDKAFLIRLEELLSVDDQAKIVGEIGIGFNPRAKATAESMLEAEKTYGTVHIAFGRNLDFHGKNSSKTHRDFLILKPTLVADGKTILKDGNIVV